MVTMALYTALGRVAGLAWDDDELDAQRPTLTVRRSYQGPPKNEASAATIDLHAELAALMRLWQAQSTSEWIFPCATGGARKRMSGKDRKILLAAAARAGIKKHVTPHVFRHSVGTWLYANTRDPKAVQRFMRHAAIKTTKEIYVKDERPIHEQVNTLQPIRPRRQLRVV
ncbi:MAG TPA: tyrosine-type recombinase/integrase [Kofleriaceae bacterium]|nr:tyrosine-type recombinase/integrase [Kofleriaceae bacterium]